MSTTYKILVGSYTDSIHTLQFDPAAESDPPRLVHLSSIRVGHHPSWIEAHPSDGSLLFAVLEQTDGQIVALKYDQASGVGEKIDEATCSSGGADPCTLLITQDELVVGNYSGGTLATIPVSTSPPYTRPHDLWSIALPFEPEMKPRQNILRQEASHPHHAALNPLNTNEQELLVTDLGSDKVWRLTRGSSDGGRWTMRSSIDTQTGGGPRHVATYGNTLYVVLELTSELAVYKYSDHGLAGLQPPTHLTTLSTLTASATPSQMKAAEILIPKPNRSFPAAYVYVSNREDPHPEGDTIAIFSLERGEERPELVTEVRTGLRHVRGMAFGGEDERWLVVGGTGSEANDFEGGGVKVYERVEGGRGLRQVAELDDAVGRTLKPTAFLWL